MRLCVHTMRSTDPPFYMLGTLIRIANINSIKKLSTPFNL
jgi:hypothetical protein